MEITLLVSPHGSITFHCDEPFIHKNIALEEIQLSIESLIEQQKHTEQIEIDDEKHEAELNF